MTEKKSTSYPKEKINILFLENISKTAVKKFMDAGYASVKQIPGALSESDLIKEIKNPDGTVALRITETNPKLLPGK